MTVYHNMSRPRY